MVDGASCETEAPGPCRSKNIQINSTRLAPMMAANVVQHKTRERPRRSRPCAGGRTSSRTTLTRVIPFPLASLVLVLHVYICAVHVRRCIPVVSVHISAAYTPKTSPLTPFAVVYRRCSLFSRFSFFSSSSFFLPASRASAPPPRDHPPISPRSSLVHDRKRRGTVLVTTSPGRSFGKRGEFSRALLLLPLSPFLSPAHATFRRSLALSPFLARIPPFYFACLCREKDSGRGELPCRMRRGDRREREREKDHERERGTMEKWWDREEKREMIIHSAVITQSPAP